MLLLKFRNSRFSGSGQSPLSSAVERLKNWLTVSVRKGSWSCKNAGIGFMADVGVPQELARKPFTP